jgi:hypothetical protein
VAAPTAAIAAVTAVDARLRPRVTAAVVRRRATVAVTPLRAVGDHTVADRPTAAGHRTVEAEDHMVAVAADMGGNTMLDTFRA